MSSRGEQRSNRRIIDLTYTLEEGMTTFPVHWHPVVEITLLGRHGIENRETRKVVLGTHTGTHVDAPRHFVPGGASIDHVPLDVLVGPASVVDFTSVPEFTEIDVEAFAAALGDRPAERIVLRFDWPRHWGKLSYYSHHPFITEATAEWLVERGCRLLGMDTPMPDNPKNGRGTERDSPVHKILLGNGVVLVEYLCNLDQINGRIVDLVVAPLKIADGDGAPARCFAVEVDEARA